MVIPTAESAHSPQLTLLSSVARQDCAPTSGKTWQHTKRTRARNPPILILTDDSVIAALDVLHHPRSSVLMMQYGGAGNIGGV
jgi:hypothetical protein